MSRNEKQGFTLLELLVVVIIVGILASVALPQFGRMTRRARASEAINITGSILTAEWAHYQEHTAFVAVASGVAPPAALLVEYPAAATDFRYAAVVGAADANVVVTGTGQVGSPAAGIVVTGTLLNDGSRSITTN